MKKSLLIVGGALALFVAVDSVYNKAFTWSAQSPDGKTNSPGDGGNCTDCHAGVAVPTPNLIQSDVPSSGYVPGETYTIGCGISSGHSKYGFQISPQDASGNLLGTLTAGTGSKVTSDKYVTHDNPFSGSVAVWSFQWTAPAAGTGDVTFYGSFLGANDNGNPTGDQVLTSTLVVSEDESAGVFDQAENPLKVYPTQVDDRLSIDNANGGKYIIYSLEGKKMREGDVDQKHFVVDQIDLAAGMYLVEVELEGDKKIVKILKK